MTADTVPRTAKTKQARAFNHQPERVRARLFLTQPFFDREDKAQVKYEMLRHREFDKAPLVEACHDFGFTRESYRHLLERFRSEGMGALFEKKRGRQQPLKVSETVRKWLWDENQRNAELGADALADRLEEQTGVRLSRRAVYRVLADTEERKKNVAGGNQAAEGFGFLDGGGEQQRLYEQWRQASLAGNQVDCFLRWGMTLLAPERWASGGVAEVRGRRASVRAGEFRLGELLLELGVLAAELHGPLSFDSNRWRCVDESRRLRTSQ